VILNFDIGKIHADQVKKATDALKVVGMQSVTWASQQMRQNGSIVTSNLINSLTYATETEQPAPKKAGAKKKGTKGSALSPAPKLSVKVGTTVVYGPRVEFGFSGRDKLGRLYNQAPRSYLRAGIIKHKDDILKIFKRIMSNG
jgi:hypothetical protein